MTSKPNYPRALSPTFMKRANEAAFWEAWVGAVLARSDLWTLHHPFAADGGDYHGLTWDLDVTADRSEEWTPLECKGLSLNFTTPDDYPFDHALICSARSWKKKWKSADTVQRSFFLISMQTGCILWVPPGVEAEVTTVTDGVRGQTYKAMRTAKSNLKPLWDFIEHIKA